MYQLLSITKLVIEVSTCVYELQVDDLQLNNSHPEFIILLHFCATEGGWSFI